MFADEFDGSNCLDIFCVPNELYALRVLILDDALDTQPVHLFFERDAEFGVMDY